MNEENLWRTERLGEARRWGVELPRRRIRPLRSLFAWCAIGLFVGMLTAATLIFGSP